MTDKQRRAAGAFLAAAVWGGHSCIGGGGQEFWMT